MYGIFDYCVLMQTFLRSFMVFPNYILHKTRLIQKDIDCTSFFLLIFGVSTLLIVVGRYEFFYVFPRAAPFVFRETEHIVSPYNAMYCSTTNYKEPDGTNRVEFMSFLDQPMQGKPAFFWLH